MLIDFHTHTFPDSIAERSMTALNERINKQAGHYLNPLTDGTASGLEKTMVREGVDISVVLPIATKPSQTDTINTVSVDIRGDKLISFATIHPQNDNKADILTKVKDDGYIGIKLHPDYQNCYIDSKEYIEILQICERLGLYTVIHAGVDGGYPPPYHAQPDRIKNTLEYISGRYLIAAHMGGYLNWDEVEKHLVGTDIYFDTAMTYGYLQPEQFRRIIKNHGADKILFGSDCPWNPPSGVLSLIESLGLDSDELEKIKWRNAADILGICCDTIDG